MNKKGLTLIELLITLTFIGIVIIFMFELLNDLRSETDNNNFAYNNQVNKADAIHTIETDLIKYNLFGIKSNSNSDIDLTFYYVSYDNNAEDESKIERKEKEAQLSIQRENVNEKNEKNYLLYTDVEGNNYKWEMKDAKVDSCAEFIFYNEGTREENEELKSYYFKLHLNLYNLNFNEMNKKGNNNAVDDIEISFYDRNDYLINNRDYLTGSSNGTYRIGNCSN